jgi:hypothetical protein
LNCYQEDHEEEGVMGRTVEIQNSVNIFVGKPEEKIAPGRSWRRYENIKKQKLGKL